MLQFTTDVEREVVHGALQLIPVGTTDKVRACSKSCSVMSPAVG